MAIVSVKIKFLVVLSVLLCGCAGYHYKHVEADGSSCSLTIVSMREVQSGAITLLDDCSLDSGADKLGANEKLIDLMSSIVKKVP